MHEEWINERTNEMLWFNVRLHAGQKRQLNLAHKNKKYTDVPEKR